MSNQQIERSEARPITGNAVKEMADFYHVPQALIALFWCDIKGNLYAKAPFHMHQAAKKGYQRIEVECKNEGSDKWCARATLYPRITSRELETLARLTVSEREGLIKYLTTPMSEEAYASKETVRNPLMYPYLREMAIKRAVARLCARYSGYGGTVYEELPDATLSNNEIQDTAN